ncbi:MAG: hypothetical protein ACR2KQ_06500 [Actinomycetota bacterium]
MEDGNHARDLRPLWRGALVTTLSVGLFPRLNAVINEDVPIWHLDPEARVLFPLILILSMLLFFFLGRWAWRTDRGNRPAKVGLVCGILSIVGAVAFFLSLPIMLGGFATTVGLEGRRRAATHGRSGQANAAVALGVFGFVIGAAIWLLAGSI